MVNALVLGATGYIGSIVTEHLSASGVKTAALVRDPQGLRGDNVRLKRLTKLKHAGVQLLEGSLQQDTAQLVQTLQGYDTVVSFLQVDVIDDELKLVEACKQAGTIKRIFPSFWGGEYPLQGKLANPLVASTMERMNVKEDVMKVVRKSGIDYTIVINDLFHGWSLPAFGSLAAPGSPVPKQATIYGDGNTRGYVTAEIDIAKVLVRAIADPQTANTKIVVRYQAPTQNELVAAYEAASGRQLPCITVSNEQLEEQIKGASELVAFVHALHKAIWIDNVNAIPPEQISEDEVVYATDLYPDITPVSIHDFYRSQQ